MLPAPLVTSNPTSADTSQDNDIPPAGRIVAACGCTPSLPLAQARGSRRRRLWELSRHAHCPVVGVCLPMAALRRLVDKVLGGKTLATDYDLHCGINNECRQRGRIAEAVEKELDRRYAPTLRQARSLKSTDALAAWWREQTGGRDVPGALWATLSHPRCDVVLEETVLSDIHMIQHQCGAADRADLARLDALQQENEVLARELGAAQRRWTQQSADHARLAEAQSAQLLRLRAELLGRDTLIASLQEDLAALEASVPALRARDELTRQVASQIERLQDLERALLRTRHELERERQRANEAVQAVEALRSQAGRPTSSEAPATTEPEEALADRAVLCVGGRPASLPAYRRLVERVGGRFLHHDGGEEDKVTRLASTLDSADVVICQTGCISHDAYWRVKDHCKRTGKRCLFVDNPSSASLRRALAALAPAAPQPQDEEAARPP
ncbi:DUF2325 domain-containing protein [Ideonella sp. YS5]|uniref:DUF2325 domain-containing protein n=1 Tax=Ideonella sp. YS5 TaxID=3453714 RepID=UPI003EEDD5AB